MAGDANDRRKQKSMKNNATHPNFILGLVSIIILFIGIGFRANGYQGGDYILIASFVLGGIHWIWSIVDVLKDFRIRGPENRRIIWVILVILVPGAGSLLYYLIGSRVRI
jgi:hypothetical protein